MLIYAYFYINLQKRKTSTEAVQTIVLSTDLGIQCIVCQFIGVIYNCYVATESI